MNKSKKGCSLNQGIWHKRTVIPFQTRDTTMWNIFHRDTDNWKKISMKNSN